MKIYKFAPIYKHTIWGGRRIASYKGISIGNKNIGESWEISAVAGSESIVCEGPEKGTSISQLIELYRSELVGESVCNRFGNEFPLLVKFIDAAHDLSVQVHPDDNLARARHGCRGKSEMWYVLDAAPDSVLYSGLKESLTPVEYERSVRVHSITDKLCRYNIHPGDCFYIPAGRIHSIGSGAFIVEIQETSDITYRIYDFNRRDVDGNLRQLHTDLAADAIDYSVEKDYRTVYTPVNDIPVNLVNTPKFTTSLLNLTHVNTFNLGDIDSFVVVIICKGEIEIVADNDESRRCTRGETLLISASTSSIQLKPLTAKADILVCHL